MGDLVWARMFSHISGDALYAMRDGFFSAGYFFLRYFFLSKSVCKTFFS